MSKAKREFAPFQIHETVFIDHQETLGDLLDAVEHGLGLWSAVKEYAEPDTKDLLVGVFRDAVAPLLERVRQLRIEDAAVLNTKHPDFADVVVGIRTAISFKRDATEKVDLR